MKINSENCYDSVDGLVMLTLKDTITTKRLHQKITISEYKNFCLILQIIKIRRETNSKSEPLINAVFNYKILLGLLLW